MTFIEDLCCVRHFIYQIPFISHNSAVEYLPLTPWYKRENWGSGRLKNWSHNKSVAESGLNPLHTHACLTRFSSIITVNTLGWIILCWRGGQWDGGQCRCYPGYGRMCNSIAGLSPRDASSISWLVPTKNLCRHCHMTSERQNYDQLRTTDVLEALPGLLGAALDQRDRALPGAGYSKVLLQLPSSYCSPHRARSPWSRGDMPPWNNPTLLDHVLFSRACEDLLPALLAVGALARLLPRGG